MELSDYNRSVDTCSNALFRFAAKHLRDRDAAKDLVQDAFLRLWTNLENVDAAKAKSYLFTTVHHLIIDRARRGNHITRFEPWHEESLHSFQPQPGVKDLIEESLATLTPQQRTLVLLRDLEGFTYEEIGRMTGLDLTKVKVYLFRARTAIKRFIGDLEFVV